MYPLFAERRCAIERPGVGARIRELREFRGMPQAELARRVEARGVPLTKQLLWSIEHEKSDPRAAVLRAIALVLGTSMDYLGSLSDIRDVMREQREEDDPGREPHSLC